MKRHIGLVEVRRSLGMNPDVFSRLACTFLGFGREGQRAGCEPLSPNELLLLCVADQIFRHTSFEETEIHLLLKELKPTLDELADTLENIYENGSPGMAVPNINLGFADFEYVSWNGVDKFFQPRTGQWLDPLPAPPVWALILHVGGCYFRFRNQLEKEWSKDARQSPQPEESVRSQ